MNLSTMEEDAALLDEYQEVESSNLAGVGSLGGDLIVVFRGGAVYRYPGAGDLLHPLLASESKGRFFNARIRPLAVYARLCPAPGCLEPAGEGAPSCAVHLTSDG
jgi:hypothetical protein